VAGLPDVPVLQLGRRMSYGEAGFGEDLILIHGSPGTGHSWARVVGKLPSNFRALTPDLPGYGGSDPLLCDPLRRTAAVADAIGALIRQRAAPVWLCGHSYGGNVALHAAIVQHERVKGLLLIEPVFIRGLELANQQQVVAETRAYFANYLVRVAFAEPGAVGSMVDFWFGDGAYATMPSQVQRFLNGAVHKNAEDVQATLSERIGAAELAAFGRPVLIAVGSASPAITKLIAGALAALLPSARVVDVPGAGHGMLDSHPQEVVGLIGALRSSINVDEQ
jgi:pimeloyl-ACP methyl ester carboxylesterase